MDIAKRLNIALPSELNQLKVDGTQIWCKRDDLLHPVISGNKWRKLEPTLQYALKHKVKHIGSFGGAYSNHLHALAYACYRLNIACTAFVRAHPNSPLSPTLQDIQSWGTALHFMSRVEYKNRDNTQTQQELIKAHSLDMLIPEGGSHQSSLDGVGGILQESTLQASLPFDNIVLPVASAGTMAGLVKYIHTHRLNTKVIGIAVLKGESYLEGSLQRLLGDSVYLGHQGNKTHWQIIHRADFHGAGYAKNTAEQLAFRASFLAEHGIALDKVYNTKSFFALTRLLAEGLISKHERTMILHTGGLQGDRE
ncbi:1-aminocyclopropane-1-carboxylate deaminase/D-cysteine desulfhydrase [Glaciecola siphonariae]|uniref:1-aminocyclopropane-1-carboxylate deaminase/D-cysteine desulfhydrase n=1 Tax=Glaciecola siphonariae TaxID=521012 RepID=A0ABV9LWY7_9ALTE